MPWRVHRRSKHRAFVDGDHVIVHVHVVRRPGDPGLAINPNGMF